MSLPPWPVAAHIGAVTLELLRRGPWSSSASTLLSGRGRNQSYRTLRCQVRHCASGAVKRRRSVGGYGPVCSLPRCSAALIGGGRSGARQIGPHPSRMGALPRAPRPQPQLADHWFGRSRCCLAALRRPPALGRCPTDRMGRGRGWPPVAGRRTRAACWPAAADR